MRIGFVSVWYERGQAYVTWTLRKALEEAGHECYVLARPGTALGERAHILTTGIWNVPRLNVATHMWVDPDEFARWVREHHLDCVIFNEEYGWYLVRRCKELGVKTVTYLDYYEPEWAKPLGEWRPREYVPGQGWVRLDGSAVFGWMDYRRANWREIVQDWGDLVPMRLYDAVLCSSHRSLDMVKDVCAAHYIGWGVDTDLFHPPAETPPYAFFHNAGWLGKNMRKNTPAAIRAFKRVMETHPTASLFVHAQEPEPEYKPAEWRERTISIERLPADCAMTVMQAPAERLRYHAETLPAPGLYHMGRVLLFPTKLEGLGLPLFEALACGMPVIATDAPPMNEYILPGQTGYLVPVAETVRRDDGIAIPETLVDEAELVRAMGIFAISPDDVERMGRNARAYAEEHLRIADLGQRVSAVLEGICE